VTFRRPSIRAAWWLVAVTVAVGVVRADEGWLIDRLAITLAIQPDGTVEANEAIDVDFDGQPHHGIFRDIRYQVLYDADRIREYDIALQGVTTEGGRPHQVKTLTNGALRRFQIGDPQRTISGKETYRLRYRIGHALNAFPDHDELYWNATGVWPVRIASAVVIVTAPGGAIDRVRCFQGPEGSRDPCRSEFTADRATYTATRPLADGEQLTIVAGLRKGAVAEPTPKLVSRPREVTEYFTTTPVYLALAGVAFTGIVGGLGALWWRVGRDRRFVALQQSPDDRREETVPLFRGRPIAVEFEPPDAIRPAQMGLLLDERADTLDVTATIIDLAVRGYLRITEIPKQGWFGHKDWQIDRLKAPDGPLLEYERIVLDGLFASGSSSTISDLKKKFYTELRKAQSALYRDAVKRGWFP
jgi:hypothetical protein